jgi:hypothetical protein
MLIETQPLKLVRSPDMAVGRVAGGAVEGDVDRLRYLFVGVGKLGAAGNAERGRRMPGGFATGSGQAFALHRESGNERGPGRAPAGIAVAVGNRPYLPVDAIADGAAEAALLMRVLPANHVSTSPISHQTGV